MPHTGPLNDGVLQAAFNRASVGMAHVTGDGRWGRINPALGRILGHSADTLTDRPIWERTDPGDRAAAHRRWAELRDGRDDGCEIETRFVRADGAIVWTRVVLNRVSAGSDGEHCFMAIVEDISGRKQAEARSRSEADLLEQSSDAILSWQLGGGIVYWSRGAERLYGFTREEALGRFSHELLKTKSRLSAGEIEAEVAEHGAWYGELVHTTRDGRAVTVESRYVRARYGGETCVLETSRDVTLRNRADADLLRSEERFRLSILNSPMPVMLFDDREEILAVSQSWLDACGYSREELRRLENWTDHAYGERSGEVLEVLRDIIANQPQARPSERVIRTKNGQQRLWTFIKSGLETQFDRRVVFVTVAQDLTERRAREEQVNLLLREVTHRAKNLLSIVQAIARLTAERAPGDFIDRFTSRVQALAANHDLLVRNDWQGVDTADLVAAQLAPFADLGSRITVSGPQMRLNAAAAQAIGFTLHELATNAGKYGSLSADAGNVEVRWHRDGDRFAMTWSETGGPPVRPPGHGGFGSTVIATMVKHQLGGEVELDYRPSGVMWAVNCPVMNVLEPDLG
jgi:PAS domain S-box-containing protein